MLLEPKRGAPLIKLSKSLAVMLLKKRTFHRDKEVLLMKHPLMDLGILATVSIMAIVVVVVFVLSM